MSVESDASHASPHLRSGRDPAASATWRQRGPSALLTAAATTLTLFLCLLPSAPAHATIVVGLTADELVEDAPRILHVRCLAKDCYRNEQGIIVTRYRVRCLERLKGDSPESEPTLELVQPGGTIGDLTTIIPGLPTFTPNEEAVLFLAPTDPKLTYDLPLGLAQGVYAVRGEDRTVSRNLGSLHVAAAPGRSPLTLRDQLPEGVSIEAFKEHLRTRIAALESNEPSETSEEDSTDAEE